MMVKKIYYKHEKWCRQDCKRKNKKYRKIKMKRNTM